MLYTKNINTISFVTNPLKKVYPHILTKHIKKNNKLIKLSLIILLKFRLSWLEKFEWIKNPDCKNKHLLKKAWDNKWKKVKIKVPNLKIIIINPSWFKVLSAITFFISFSKNEQNPETKKVATPKKKSIDSINFTQNKELYLIKIKMPAVTRVLEWTRALVGVGAAIAWGNHELKGNWALFVIKPKKKKNWKPSFKKKRRYISSSKKKKNQKNN